MNLSEYKKDVVYRCIGNDFNDGVIACGYMPKPTAESSQYNFVHGHYSCFILLSGQGTYIQNDGRQIPIQRGSFVQRLPGIAHSTKVVPDGQWLEFFVSFGKPIYDYMRQLQLLPKGPVSPSTYTLSDCTGFDLFLNQLKSAKVEQLPMLLPDVQKLALKMSHLPMSNDYNPTSDSSYAAVKAACSILSSDFEVNIDLPQLALDLHMSYENFRKSFKKAIGVSPAHYRCCQKMNHAKLVLGSGISIKETALMTGYSDTYAFTKQFSKIVGMPPGAYVQQSQKLLLSQQ